MNVDASKTAAATSSAQSTGTPGEAAEGLPSELLLHQVLEAPGTSPAERAAQLSSLGRRFFADFQLRQKLESLGEAVRYAREALESFPADPATHDAVGKYAETLVFYAQTKAIVVRGLESTEEYITIVQAAIAATPACTVHNQLPQRLAWAYWTRFEFSKTADDLNNVISYIEGLVNAGHDLLPETDLVLAQSYRSRFSSTKATEDLERSIKLLEKALKAPGAELPFRHQLLEKLVQYSLDMLHHSKQEPDLDRLISNAKFAIAELPQSETAQKTRIREIMSRAEASKEMLAQGRMVSSILKEVLAVDPDANKGPKHIGKTFVPESLYSKFPVSHKEVRKLELMPGKSDEDIVCKLHTISLADDVLYEVGHHTRPSTTENILISRRRCHIPGVIQAMSQTSQSRQANAKSQ
jgi:tetratricopeptide (TPR) repeat protein